MITTAIKTVNVTQYMIGSSGTRISREGILILTIDTKTITFSTSPKSIKLLVEDVSVVLL